MLFLAQYHYNALSIKTAVTVSCNIADFNNTMLLGFLVNNIFTSLCISMPIIIKAKLHNKAILLYHNTSFSRTFPVLMFLQEHHYDLSALE